ncbi:hypothetical protein FocTR4_00003944 [Fusarium oxysporum f. sp. cubense]|uniref:C2H2-type domain-containing protein n=2 Tax=Fusarium oxysporum species complex TaxID=171631 RepID=A0A5C6TA51_FUSOC|nr:hypothetical protein FocTR4_00003944 [Fusarium oxysporum f. sp. cubense]
MEGRSPDDGLLSMSEEDFVLDFASDDLDSLPWNAPYGTNDAAFADVHQETTFSDTVDSINSNSFDIYSDHINPILNNTQELPALDTTYFDILLMNWDFMAMPTDPITTTHAGSITTTEQSNCSTTYTSSSSPMTESSPIGLSQSQVSDPLSTKDAENVSITIARRRRTKMEPGTRPCDLKRQKRKEDKPEKCHICEKGHQWKRDLERHYRSNHPDEAAKMGLSRSKPILKTFFLSCRSTTSLFNERPKATTSRTSARMERSSSLSLVPTFTAMAGSLSLPKSARSTKRTGTKVPMRAGNVIKHDIRWLCEDEDCEMVGEAFETNALFREHVRNSSGHKYWLAGDTANDNDSVFTPSLNSSHQTAEDDVFGPFASDGNICNEPCCRHYGTDYKCKSEFNRHADTGAHRTAANLSNVLLSSIPTASALQAEQEGLRSFRCNSRSCHRHGEVFSTAKAFFNHLKDDEHRDGWYVKFDDDDLDYSSDRDGLPGIQFYAGGKKGRCVNEKCPRFRFQFDSYGAMKQHSRSLGHVRAEEDLGLTDADESGEEVWKKSAVHGMEVAEDGLLWKCTKQGCKKFNVVIKGLGNAKSHYNSDTHLTAAEEIATSSDESVEHIEGMEFLKDGDGWRCLKRGCRKFNKFFLHLGNAKKHASGDSHALAEEPDSADENLDGLDYSMEEGVWTCVKPGCKRINAIYQHLTSARKHANANFHALAEEPAEEILEDIEGMVVLDGESAYMCIKFGCKGSGKTYSNVRSAKLHANARPHMKAGDISAFMPNQFNMDLFATPTRTPRNLLLTPMETEESTIVVTPGSPSAGRGTNPAGHPAGARNGTSARTTKMIRLGRSSVTTAGSSKHEVLERKNRELESRVAKLEMQMGQVLGSQSPQIQNNAHYQNSQVHQSAQWFQQIPELPQAHETTCARVEGLSKFVRAAYRPKMSMPVNEDEL